ncbi:MAG TPA: response regulator [Dehalococcoidia bacterium]|nr:response regulator [Dehalococcoidia bacterium]
MISQEQPRHSGDASQGTAAPPKGKASILVVEDDLRLMRLERFILEEEGYSVALASSGEEALHTLEESHPSLVLLDIGLPGMDGFDTCRRIREVSEVPIIMVTSRDTATDKVQGLEIGADDYITKPFMPDELAARVKATLRRTGIGNHRESPAPEGPVSHAPAAGEVIPAQQLIPVPMTDTELYEGVVRVSLEAASSLRQVMQFVGQLRQNPQFRLLRLAANQSSKDGMDIWLSLRQPTYLKKVLLDMTGVSQVNAPPQPDAKSPERLLTVCLSP